MILKFTLSINFFLNLMTDAFIFSRTENCDVTHTSGVFKYTGIISFRQRKQIWF